VKKIVLTIALLASLVITAQNYNFLGSYTSNGTPLYLESPGDTVSAETMQMISNSLPESYPVPDYNPHYISSGYDTNVEINALADVYVTFVSEGAGYKNVLGFYTYDILNPPTTAPQPEDITIIFPNASALNSGGGLQTGDKVKLGTFPAGTGIGWVLLANAWNSSGSTVGNGQWQLYSDVDFNPEADPNLRYHNVLLNDPDNERIILGFEDIRRDYGSCDNDFNDAIFYITANPYAAIMTSNFADVSSASDVTSGNDGGLESNGDLASLIAKRNFIRKKTGDVHNSISTQAAYEKPLSVTYRSTGIPSIDTYLPTTGMYGTETAYVSSPTDLIGITNATDVFALDMYQGNTRVSAVLATATQGSVYDHSKVICDRLNSSSLEDVRTVTVRGHQVISAKIIRATGETEYTLSFSVKLATAQNELFSFWNLAQYPAGDFYNFQIWGSSFSQVFTIGNHIIDTFTAEKPFVSTAVPDVVPQVFVKSGTYNNGALELDIVNKVAATAIDFNANISGSETLASTALSQSIPLNGNWEESLIIPTGSLFDVGFSLQVPGYTQQDALYLADGPWGVDYDDTLAQITTFDIANPAITYDDTLYEIERQPTVSGTVTGNVNVFRHVLPGDQTLDVTGYGSIQFNMASNLPMEIVLVPNDLTDWNNRLRYNIAPNTSSTFYTINFSDFVDANGQPGVLTDVKTIVFSVMGDYANAAAFNLSIANVAFGPVQTLNVNTFETELATVSVYPNPMVSQARFRFKSVQAEALNLVIYNTLGSVVKVIKHNTSSGANEIRIDRAGLSRGLYFCKLEGSSTNYNTTKLVVK